MATWLNLSGSDIPLVDDVADLVGNLSGPLNLASNAAATAAAALNFITPFLGVAVDFLGAVRAAINALIVDIINTGCYVLLVKPDLYDRSTNKGPDGFLRIIKTAMNDIGDLNRPKFAAGDTTTGVIFMAAAPSFAEIALVAAQLEALFGSDAWRELIDFAASTRISIPEVRVETVGTVTALVPGGDARTTWIDNTQDGIFEGDYDPYAGQLVMFLSGLNVGQFSRVTHFYPDPRIFEVSPKFPNKVNVGDQFMISFNCPPQPPDWIKARLVDVFPPVALSCSALATVRDLIPVTGAANIASKLADLLSRKAALLAQVSAQLDALVDLLGNLSSIPSISMLPIPPQSGGNSGFTWEAFAATNPPPVGANDYTIGLVVYGGSGLYNVLKKVFPLP